MGEACSKDVHKRQKREKGRDVIGWKMQEIMSVCTCFERDRTWALCTRFCASCLRRTCPPMYIHVRQQGREGIRRRWSKPAA